MSDLFEDESKHEWILIVTGTDPEIEQQTSALAQYCSHCRDRDLVVLTVCSGAVSVAHGDCDCGKTARELAAKYDISLDQFSSTLIDRDDCVKWSAPTPIHMMDIISVIDEMPLHDAENATRGPAPVG